MAVLGWSRSGAPPDQILDPSLRLAGGNLLKIVKQANHSASMPKSHFIPPQNIFWPSKNVMVVHIFIHRVLSIPSQIDRFYH